MNTANPTSMIMSAVIMLRHLNLEEYANRISKAVYKTIADGRVKTPDMGGSQSTTDFTLAVISNL